MLFLDIKISFDSTEKAKIFFDSMKPELSEEFARSETKVFSKGNNLEWKIRASDKTALRASLNVLIKPLKLFGDLEALK